MMIYHTIQKICCQLRTDVLIWRLPIDLSAIETRAVRVASLKENRSHIDSPGRGFANESTSVCCAESDISGFRSCNLIPNFSARASISIFIADDNVHFYIDMNLLNLF
jgi:hypothetical protein